MTAKKKTTKRVTKAKPIILCAGEHGRAVVFGYVTKKPVPGKPVTLTDARMVLRWDSQCGGLFGLAAKGPRGEGARITHAVASTTATLWREHLDVTPEAAAEIEAWKAV